MIILFGYLRVQHNVGKVCSNFGPQCSLVTSWNMFEDSASLANEQKHFINLLKVQVRYNNLFFLAVKSLKQWVLKALSFGSCWTINANLSYQPDQTGKELFSVMSVNVNHIIRRVPIFEYLTLNQVPIEYQIFSRYFIAREQARSSLKFACNHVK